MTSRLAVHVAVLDGDGRVLVVREEGRYTLPGGRVLPVCDLDQDVRQLVRAAAGVEVELEEVLVTLSGTPLGVVVTASLAQPAPLSAEWVRPGDASAGMGASAVLLAAFAALASRAVPRV